MSGQDADTSSQTLQLIRSGREATQRGDLANAEELFHKAAILAPNLSNAFLGLGLVQLRRAEYADAVASLTRSSELNAHLKGTHLFLGIAQHQLGQGADAATSLRTEIALDPNNVEALKWLGIVELEAGHPEEATGPLDQAARIVPNEPEIIYYKARSHNLVAAAAYQELTRINPDSSLAHRALAEKFDTAGQPEKAIAEYEAAIRKDPANPDLYESLGEEDQKIARFAAANTAYEEELKLNPHSGIAFYHLGKIAVSTGRTEAGVAYLRKASAAHTVPAPTDFYLGLGLAELGQAEEAAHWLELCLASQPSPFIEQSAYFQLARVYKKLNRTSEAQKALVVLQKLKSDSAGNGAPPEQALEQPPKEKDLSQP